MTKALYPGSFDPITNGHLAIIKRAHGLFDALVVAVVHNPNKPTLFSLAERQRLVQDVLKGEGITGVDVVTYDGLLVDFAREMQVKAVVRGLRVNSDFEYEFQMALMNRDMAPEIESVFLMTSGRYIFLSSSIIKEVKSYGGDVSHLVPPVVNRALSSYFS